MVVTFKIREKQDSVLSVRTPPDHHLYYTGQDNTWLAKLAEHFLLLLQKDYLDYYDSKDTIIVICRVGQEGRYPYTVSSGMSLMEKRGGTSIISSSCSMSVKVPFSA